VANEVEEATMTPNEDQLPQGWSDGADGYDDNFAGFTGLYADEVLDLLGVGPGTALLDVAAGSGATSVRAAQRGAGVLSTDFAAGMVEIADRRLREGGFGDSAARQMDGQSLDLPDDSFDVGVSMFGLMFFPDTGSGIAELARVVRPGGRIGLATWDLEGFGMHRLIGGALEVAVPGFGDHPRPEPTWAHLGTVDGVSQLLASAGLTAVAVAPMVRRWHFEDPERFFAEMPSWSCPVRPLFEMLPQDRIDAAAAAFADLVAAEGGMLDGEGIPMSALVGTATVG
jgi:ubiquinone/menaquinone biosynthesis C-methylase UbiE